MGKLGINSCFWKSYNHILMHFVPQFQCFELFLNLFQKLFFFLKFSESLPISIDPTYFSINRNSFKLSKEASVCFDWSKLFFDQSKLFWNCFKFFLTSLCLFRSFETIFWSIETRQSGFKKFIFDLFKTLFQNFS